MYRVPSWTTRCTESSAKLSQYRCTFISWSSTQVSVFFIRFPSLEFVGCRLHHRLYGAAPGLRVPIGCLETPIWAVHVALQRRALDDHDVGHGSAFRSVRVRLDEAWAVRPYSLILQVDHNRTVAHIAGHGAVQILALPRCEVSPLCNPVVPTEQQPRRPSSARLTDREPVLTTPCLGRIHCLECASLIEFNAHAFL